MAKQKTVSRDGTCARCGEYKSECRTDPARRGDGLLRALGHYFDAFRSGGDAVANVKLGGLVGQIHIAIAEMTGICFDCIDRQVGDWTTEAGHAEAKSD